MHRRNYGKKSGVIIDICTEHGMWLDPGELERILSWVRQGGLARAERQALEQVRDETRVRNTQGPVVGSLFESKDSSQDVSAVDLVVWVVDALGSAWHFLRR
jgi:Zn-finger nucleic acid-binding protein